MARGRKPYSGIERIAAFISKYDAPSIDECWPWKGRISAKGYGQFRTEFGVEPAHRVAYKLWVGTIPSGLVLDHLCRNRSCVNPLHLEPVTNAENQRRGLLNQNAVKVACGTCGGPFDYAYQGVNGNTWRRCTPCNSRRKREARAGLRLWRST